MNLSEVILDKIKRDHQGKENAITRKDLLRYCKSYAYRQYPHDLRSIYGISDRQLRNAYCQLPVISSAVGIFWPTRQSELNEFEEYCRKKALPLFNRVKMVMEKHKDLRVGEYVQKELF